jgi:uncharacterized protein (TIGR02147 family)
MAQRILDKLPIPPEEVQAALQILDELGPLSRRPGSLGASRSDGLTSYREFVQLNMDQFRLISDWHHYAILSLVETKTFREDSDWIAKRLGIDAARAQSSLDGLLRLGLLIRTRGGKLKHGGKQITTTIDIPNASLRRAHYQNLDLARRSLDSDPVTERGFSSITVATTPRKLEEAKRRIREFRRNLTTYLEADEKTEVYQINFQMFPLTTTTGGAGRF